MQPVINVEILGINRSDDSANNSSFLEDVSLVWLQDTAAQSVWNRWSATYRDVFILDSRNQVYAVFNLTQHDLGDPQNREQIKSLFLDAARIVDTDHDGLPDDWEQANFGDLAPRPSDDTDGDGVDNFFEYAFGTNPHNPNSKSSFRVTVSASGPDRFCTVTFRRRAGSHVKYILETSADLNQWSSSPAAIRLIEAFRNSFDGTGTGETTIALTTPIQLQSQAYIRVRAVLSSPP